MSKGFDPTGQPGLLGGTFLLAGAMEEAKVNREMQQQLLRGEGATRINVHPAGAAQEAERHRARIEEGKEEFVASDDPKRKRADEFLQDAGIDSGLDNYGRQRLTHRDHASLTAQQSIQHSGLQGIVDRAHAFEGGSSEEEFKSAVGTESAAGTESAEAQGFEPIGSESEITEWEQSSFSSSMFSERRPLQDRPLAGRPLANEAEVRTSLIHGLPINNEADLVLNPLTRPLHFGPRRPMIEPPPELALIRSRHGPFHLDDPDEDAQIDDIVKLDKRGTHKIKTGIAHRPAPRAVEPTNIGAINLLDISSSGFVEESKSELELPQKRGALSASQSSGFSQPAIHTGIARSAQKISLQQLANNGFQPDPAESKQALQNNIAAIKVIIDTMDDNNPIMKWFVDFFRYYLKKPTLSYGEIWESIFDDIDNLWVLNLFTYIQEQPSQPNIGVFGSMFSESTKLTAPDLKDQSIKNVWQIIYGYVQQINVMARLVIEEENKLTQNIMDALSAGEAAALEAAELGYQFAEEKVIPPVVDESARLDSQEGIPTPPRSVMSTISDRDRERIKKQLIEIAGMFARDPIAALTKMRDIKREIDKKVTLVNRVKVLMRGEQINNQGSIDMPRDDRKMLEDYMLVEENAPIDRKDVAARLEKDKSVLVQLQQAVARAISSDADSMPSNILQSLILMQQHIEQQGEGIDADLSSRIQMLQTSILGAMLQALPHRVREDIRSAQIRFRANRRAVQAVTAILAALGGAAATQVVVFLTHYGLISQQSADRVTDILSRIKDTPQVIENVVQIISETNLETIAGIKEMWDKLAALAFRKGAAQFTNKLDRHLILEPTTEERKSGARIQEPSETESEQFAARRMPAVKQKQQPRKKQASGSVKSSIKSSKTSRSSRKPGPSSFITKTIAEGVQEVGL